MATTRSGTRAPQADEGSASISAKFPGEEESRLRIPKRIWFSGAQLELLSANQAGLTVRADYGSEDGRLKADFFFRKAPNAFGIAKGNVSFSDSREFVKLDIGVRPDHKTGVWYAALEGAEVDDWAFRCEDNGVDKPKVFVELKDYSSGGKRRIPEDTLTVAEEYIDLSGDNKLVREAEVAFRHVFEILI